MTLHQQLLAIAWWDEPQYEWHIINGEVVRPSAFLEKENGVYWPCKDYLSLDVLHECEKKLTDRQKDIYVGWLMNKQKWSALTSGEERLEALVRTLNLWL